MYRPKGAPCEANLRGWFAGILLGTLLLLTSQPLAAARGATPEEVLKAYLAAVYARDYPAAYELISLEDRKSKTKREYVREQGAF